MRLVTWNLNHRQQPRKLRPEVVAALAALQPDLVVLTEYFPGGPGREEFIEKLRLAGLQHVALSTSPHGGVHNHILVAARETLEGGDVVAPDNIHADVPSNAIHVRLSRCGLDLFGVRVPDFEQRRKALRRATWDWIDEVATVLRPRVAAILGDFNTDPSYEASNCGDRIGQLVERGWQLAAPETGASYWTLQGAAKRIDHAFVAPSLRVLRAEYVTRVGQFCLAGEPGALSDHAALVIDVEVPP